MRLIDATELMEHVYRDRLDSRELIVQLIENIMIIVIFLQHSKSKFLKKLLNPHISMVISTVVLVVIIM